MKFVNNWANEWVEHTSQEWTRYKIEESLINTKSTFKLVKNFVKSRVTCAFNLNLENLVWRFENFYELHAKLLNSTFYLSLRL